VHAFEPHYEGSPVVWQAADTQPLSSAKGSHRFDARPGHHLAPAALASGANVFDVLGTGFTLLALGSQADAAAVQAFRDAAAELSLPLTVVEDDGGGEAARYQAKLVLVRPDQFVAWSSREGHVDQAEARELLKRALGDA
jgi:4-hydroxyisophthalate hydroxylase